MRAPARTDSWMTSTLLHHLAPLGAVAALLFVRLFFKVIRLAVLLVVAGLVVLSAFGLR